MLEPSFNKVKEFSKTVSGRSYLPLLINLRISSRSLREGASLARSAWSLCWLVSILINIIEDIRH